MPITKKPKPLRLDKYEQEIEDNLEKSKPLSSHQKTLEMNKLHLAAKGHVTKRKKEKRISIRVLAADLERIKALAEDEGLPYQTFLTSILHKFSIGRLVPKERNA